MAKKDKKSKADKAVEKVKAGKNKAAKTEAGKNRAARADRSAKPSGDGTRIITGPCRSSYMFVNEPRENDDGEMVYSSQVLIRKKDKATLAKMEKAVLLAAKKKFGEKVKLGQLKLPLRDADKEEREGAEYEGVYFLNCKNFRKPGAVNRANDTLIGEERNEMLYSGAHYRFSLSFYGFDNRGSKGVAVYLNNVMFHKHDDRLDGGVAAEDEFEDYGEDDDEFDD